ncbi:Abscisic acid G-protein coupled receptor-domain-containing protein [Lactifluus volemus]|nr:Abscisic acid G-protein coupled receptor-domain-containing protein [Lactifluus volemus]
MPLSSGEPPLESQSFFFGTSFLVAIRLGLFATCRRFIDRSLYNELKQISQSSSSGVSVELDTLPHPHAKPTSISERRTSNDSHSVLSKIIFSFCFSESCTLFLLLMCHGSDTLNTRTRLINWRISLYALLLNIILVIPVSLCVVCTTSLNSTSVTVKYRHIVAVLAPLLVYFLLLSYVPLPDALVFSEGSNTFTLVTARYNVLGTCILGSLSGFGSMATSWGYFPLRCGRNRKNLTRADLDRVEQSFARVRADLASKREEVTSLRIREASQAEGGQKLSWLNRLPPNFLGNGVLSNAEAELRALSSLEENMASELRYLQQRYAQETFDKTWQGRIFVLMRHATGFYCIFRSLASFSNILLPASQPITLTDSPPSVLLRLISRPSSTTEANLAYATRQANLVLVGAVIIGSIRRVLYGAARALKSTPASRNRVASLVLLALAQLMGIYLLSTLVQLRTSFPPATDETGTAAAFFSNLPAYETFGSVFDWSFLASAGFAAVVEWLREQANQSL